ncbi:hypothetical protein ACOMHN_035612 [Nucella lapillus]
MDEVVAAAGKISETMDEFDDFDDIENMDVDSIMDEFEVFDDIENMDVDSIMDEFEVFDDIENMDVDSILSPELYSHQTSGTKRPHLDLGLDSMESTPSPQEAEEYLLRPGRHLGSQPKSPARHLSRGSGREP